MNIFESIIDQTVRDFSPYVFNDPTSASPTIKDRLRHKIISDVQRISNKLKVSEVFIKGSILTKQYTKDSDIDIFIRINTSIYNDKQIFAILKPIWDEIDNAHVDGIPHPLQYYITTKSYNFDNTEAAYDIINQDWIKRTPSKNIHIDDYIKDFQKYIDQFADFSEELRRSMIDYNILKDIPVDQVKGLDAKLNKILITINTNIANLENTYSDIKQFRDESFSNKMTPSEIKKYGIKTKLPGNVVFKLIERYHYIDLTKRIKKIVGDDGKLSHDEFAKLNDTLKTELTTETSSFAKIFNSNINGRGDMQHKARHRQQQTNVGMIGHGSRKSLNVVPDYQRKDPIKGNRSIDAAKKQSRIIRVKQGSPEARRLADKYRIGDPVGKKTVAGNQYDAGITIIFEETLSQKIERANRALKDK